MAEHGPVTPLAAGEPCPVCGETLVPVKLFAQRWVECGITVLDGLGIALPEYQRQVDLHNAADAAERREE